MATPLNKAEKALQSVQTSSHMDSPSDAVKIAVQFARLPDGTHHISTDGASKQRKG